MKDNWHPVVSCVTPFYNTADFLAECIEHTLHQSFGDFELILVDNCSTDGSDEIAQEYAARDCRIRFFRNEKFLTQIQNYNQSLSHISEHSRYCKIVQADDKIYPGCLAEMVDIADAHPSVGVVSSYRIVGAEVMPRSLPDLSAVRTGEQAAKLELLEDLSLFGTPTTVMFRSSIVRTMKPFFPEGARFPDTAAVFEVLRQSDFGFVHQILSFTRLDEESIYGRWQSYHPMLLARLIQLVAYGPGLLTQDQYSRELTRLRKTYDNMLAREWMRRREPEFWEFHRKGLAEIGMKLEGAAMVRAAARILLGYAVSPGRAMAAVARRF